MKTLPPPPKGWTSCASFPEQARSMISQVASPRSIVEASSKIWRRRRTSRAKAIRVSRQAGVAKARTHSTMMTAWSSPLGVVHRACTRPMTGRELRRLRLAHVHIDSPT